MTSAAAAPPRTASPRKAGRWMLLTLLCLAVHVGLIWLLEEQPAGATARPQSHAAIQWLADSWLLERISALPGTHDPAVFALPSLDGFSGSAWLTFKASEPEFSAPSLPAHWLELTVEDLGNVFERLFTTNMPATIQIADLPLPTPLGTLTDVAHELSVPPSSVQADATLAERLPHVTGLPGWPNPELLTNSVVQVVIDGLGRCVSATLLGGCGLKDADAFALKWAQQRRFKPSRTALYNPAAADALVTGKLIFHWQTLPPQPAAAPGASPGL